MVQGERAAGVADAVPVGSSVAREDAAGLDPDGPNHDSGAGFVVGRSQQSGYLLPDQSFSVA